MYGEKNYMVKKIEYIYFANIRINKSKTKPSLNQN